MPDDSQRPPSVVDPEITEQSHADGPAESVTHVPVEAHLTERAAVWHDARDTEAVRVESALVRRFAAYLEEVGHETSSIVVRIDQERIRADLFDRTEAVLYEAKASADRQKIRMAIGQLLDYRRFLTATPATGSPAGSSESRPEPSAR